MIDQGNAQKTTHRVPVLYFHFGAVVLHANVKTKVYYLHFNGGGGVMGSDRSCEAPGSILIDLYSGVPTLLFLFF